MSWTPERLADAIQGLDRVVPVAPDDGAAPARFASLVAAVAEGPEAGAGLGEAYAALLERHPTREAAGRWRFTAAAGHARKRQGSYYTPEALVALALDLALEPVLDAAWAAPEPRRALTALRVLDPAAGAGAFLLGAAGRIARRFEALGEAPEAAWALALGAVHGIDRDKAALAIATASLLAPLGAGRRPEAASGLRQRLRRADALVAFPFAGTFDAVLGNPPWERLKVQAREFFAGRAPAIAALPTASARQAAIAALEDTDPGLAAEFAGAQAEAAAASRFVRESGAFPLTGRGDLNAYAPFAELALARVSPSGRIGLWVPSGIATEASTAPFWRHLVDERRLVALYDFENRARLFPAVAGSVKFSLLVAAGAPRSEAPTIACFLKAPDEARDPARLMRLEAADLARLNPETRTLPVFRSRRDAELTLAVHARHPAFFAGGNPWGARFFRMFDMTNDAHRFVPTEVLAAAGARFEPGGTVRAPDGAAYRALWEAKLLHHYEPRFATYEPGGDRRQTTELERADPAYWPLPRYWVPDEAYASRRPGAPAWAFGVRAIARSVDERTAIGTLLPAVALGNSVLGLDVGVPPERAWRLYAYLASFAFDYVVRQKIGGANLNQFLWRQLPVPAPDSPAWEALDGLEADYAALVGACAALDPFQEAAFGRVARDSDPASRLARRARLEAACFEVAGWDAESAAHVLESFPIALRHERARWGAPRTRELVLEALTP